MTPEMIAERWAKVGDFSEGATNPESNQEMMEVIMNNMEQEKEREAAAAQAAPPKSGLASEEIFNMMGAYLDGGHGKDAVGKVKAVLGFNILKKKGAKPSLVFEIDLKNGQGSVK